MKQFPDVKELQIEQKDRHRSREGSGETNGRSNAPGDEQRGWVMWSGEQLKAPRDAEGGGKEACARGQSSTQQPKDTGDDKRSRRAEKMYPGE
jgi:hypothetical protein